MNNFCGKYITHNYLKLDSSTRRLLHISIQGTSTIKLPVQDSRKVQLDNSKR